ncbi:NAD-binding protein [Falsochrobactrum sp. TDYN1]|uniref:NAD-binding protein n=1 Tax=Falsochrobactrum tianjinense TaxID=2706015 RepID=A0A949PK01_9HYPH|nr:3-hydroxyacyl-CoA dehydrogenase NAD-binding domain-containing protein [Falsochrobactrum sp. TDYN1]MBV2142148.1 NAD-binding protein [Falsochrobactrum sp. TDYN1]
MIRSHKIAVIGGGLIGMSWASLFVAQGHEVTIVDPRSEAGDEFQAFLRDAWPMLRSLGLAEECCPPRVTVSQDIAAIKEADFVQECGPDRINVKRDLIAQIEEQIAHDTIIASSTSSLTATDIQRDALRPARILVGHPMNPPHLVPMVELVAGKLTTPDTVNRAEAFYNALKRVTIRVQKEVPGHLANRLTSALYREAVHIVAEGIATVEDVDKAISYGPGMRWALMGPHLIYHLGGGKGGYRHYLDHLGPTQEARWREHGTSQLTEAVKNALIGGIEKELANMDEASLTQRRDAALVELFQLKQKFGF